MPRSKDTATDRFRAGVADGLQSDSEREPAEPPGAPAVTLETRPGGTVEIRTGPNADRRRAGTPPPAPSTPVEAAIVERYRRGDGTIEETMLELHQAGISVRRAEAAARALWGAQVTAATVSEFNARIAARISRWRNRPIRGPHPYVFLGAIELPCRWGRETRAVHVLAAVGVNRKGFREVLGVGDGANGDPRAWRPFLRRLKARGLTGVRLVVTAPDPRIGAAAAAVWPVAARQICLWQLHRELLAQVGLEQLPGVLVLLRAILAGGNPRSARVRTREAVAALRRMRLPAAARMLEQAGGSLPSHLAFPRRHWRHLRSNQALMKVLRQIRERTCLVGAFSDGDGALLLACARLRYMADQWSASPHPWDMSNLTAQSGKNEAGSTGPRAGNRARNRTADHSPRAALRR